MATLNALKRSFFHVRPRRHDQPNVYRDVTKVAVGSTVTVGLNWNAIVINQYDTTISSATWEQSGNTLTTASAANDTITTQINVAVTAPGKTILKNEVTLANGLVLVHYIEVVGFDFSDDVTSVGVPVNGSGLDHGGLQGLSDDDHPQYILHTDIGSDGFVVRTASETYTDRSISAATGLTVTNGDGVSGNPTIDYDINSLSADGSPDGAADYVVTYDASAGAHKKVLVQDISSGSNTFASIEVDGTGVSTNAPTLDFDGTDFTLTESPTDDFDVTIKEERIQDIVGAMVTGNTETLISVTYEDGDGTLDFVVDEASIDHDNLTGFVANEHIDWTGASDNFDTTGTASVTDVLTVRGNATNAGRVRFGEDTDNGSNYAEVIAPASLSSNVTLTLPDATTTLVGDDTTNTFTNKSGNISQWTNDSGYVTATLTQEEVEDYVGAMLTGNTETLITVTYQDGDGTIDFVVDNDLANYSNTNSAFVAAGDNVSDLTNDAGYITATLTDEEVEDIVGAMLTGNTETGITVTYQDTTGDIDFVVSDTTVAGDSGSTGITPGDTLTIAGGTNATTAMSGDTLTVNVDDAFLSNTGDVGTGVYDFGGATSFEIPNGATPTVDAAGEIAIDTSITDYTGLIKYHDGTEELTVVAMPTGNLTTTDNHVVVYDAAGNEFKMEAQSGGGGSALETQVDGTTQSTDTTTYDFDGTDFTLTESPADDFDITINPERIEDIVGGMLTGNTETGITVTYQDGDGTIDFVVDEASINHDNLTGFVANEHIDWTSTTQDLDTTGSGTFTEFVYVRGTATTPGVLYLGEDTDNGSAFVGVRAPASMASNRTLDLPDANDTLVGKATTDTLTNKTINTASNTITVVEADISDLQSYLVNVSEDTTPQLGGNLDVNGNKIVSTSNGDIDIEPNGTGNVLLGNMTFDADQTIGAGQDNYVLTYDNSSGLISLEAAAAGGSGDEWGDPVDADIVPDGDGTRDLGATGTRFAETYTDALDVTNNITVGGTVDGRDIATDGTKLDGIEASADVTDETNVLAALNGASISAAVIAAADKILFQDANDSDNLKVETFSDFEGALSITESQISDLGSYITASSSDNLTNKTGNISQWTNDSGYITATLTDEQVEDIVGAMLTGNTETGITVTYQDATGDIDFVVSDTTVAGDSGSTGITPGDTLTIAGGTEITTAMSGDTLTINADFTPSSTDTLTNKTFDANGTGNSLSNVDVADLADGTDGELITWDASGNPTTVSVGTSGQVLTSNGAGAAPTFQDAAGGGASAATQAEQETGTATDVYVSPGRQQYHASAAKFWVSIDTDDGTAADINASYNVTSITDNGTGDYTVTIATDFSGAEYALASMLKPTSAQSNQTLVLTPNVQYNDTPAAGDFDINVRLNAVGKVDPDTVMVVGYGDQ